MTIEPHAANGLNRKGEPSEYDRSKALAPAALTRVTAAPIG